jgi:hypothetical protein
MYLINLLMFQHKIFQKRTSTSEITKCFERNLHTFSSQIKVKMLHTLNISSDQYMNDYSVFITTRVINILVKQSVGKVKENLNLSKCNKFKVNIHRNDTPYISF